MTVKVTEVIMPQLGVNDESVTVMQWMQENGAAVRRGQTLAILETTKASFELECEEDGYFYATVEECAKVPVQSVIAVILSAQDEKAFQSIKKKMKTKTPESRQTDVEVTLTAGAKQLAEIHHIDIRKLPHGRVIREKDILALVQAKDSETAASSPGNALQRIVIYGASAGGECVADLLHTIGGYEVVAFLEDNPILVGGTCNGIPIKPGDSLKHLRQEGVGAVTTHIADPKFRLQLIRRAKTAGLFMLNIIHPTAFIAPTVRMGIGNLIKAGAVIDSEVIIGDGCIIDNGVIIPHHNRIGSGCHLAPGVSMGGGCVIGDGCIIGIGSTISARITIGTNVIVGVGTVVARNVPDNVIIEGVPAKIIGTRKPI